MVDTLGFHHRLITCDLGCIPLHADLKISTINSMGFTVLGYVKMFSRE